MATLVGRECWWGGNVLNHGVIMDNDRNSSAIMIRNDNGRNDFVIPALVAMDRKSAHRNLRGRGAVLAAGAGAVGEGDRGGEGMKIY